MFLIIFVAALIFNLVSAVQTEDSSNLKLSETSNKYVSSQLYVFGGFDADGKRQASASQFNSSTGEWDSINDMKVGKDASCGTVVGTKIYLFGGDSDSGTLKTVEIYDCKTGTYSEYRALSRSGPRWGCGAAVLNGFIYVAGGYDGSKRLSSVIRYNIETTHRENILPMHIVREGNQLVELNGCLYAIGGGTSAVEVYDPVTGQWSERASTQYAHYFIGAAIHDGKIYVLSNLGFEVYSPDIDQWNTLAPLTNLEGSSLISMNGKLWSLGGGRRADFKGTKSMFVYNMATNQWNKQFDMDVGRMYHISFVVNH